jgi:hypothetical protein
MNTFDKVKLIYTQFWQISESDFDFLEGCRQELAELQTSIETMKTIKTFEVIITKRQQHYPISDALKLRILKGAKKQICTFPYLDYPPWFDISNR